MRCAATSAPRRRGRRASSTTSSSRSPVPQREGRSARLRPRRRLPRRRQRWRASASCARSEGGVVTAGNASQQNDAAAACLVVAEDKLEELGLEPIAWFIGCGRGGLRSEPHGHRPGPGGRAAVRAHRHRLGRHRPGRTQRGVRAAGARGAQGLGLVGRRQPPRNPQRQRLGHLARPPDRRDRRPHPRQPGARDAPARRHATASRRCASAAARASPRCSSARPDARRAAIGRPGSGAKNGAPTGSTRRSRHAGWRRSTCRAQAGADAAGHPLLPVHARRADRRARARMVIPAATTAPPASSRRSRCRAGCGPRARSSSSHRSRSATQDRAHCRGSPRSRPSRARAARWCSSRSCTRPLPTARWRCARRRHWSIAKPLRPSAPLQPRDAGRDARSIRRQWQDHRALTPHEPLLFRFSALTFNTHRIHYDLPYARDVERYRGLVVHGPLMASLLLQLARAGSANRRYAFRSARQPRHRRRAAAPRVASGRRRARRSVRSPSDGREVVQRRSDALGDLRAARAGARRFDGNHGYPADRTPTLPPCRTCRRRCSPRRSRSPAHVGDDWLEPQQADYSSDDDAIWNDLFARQMDVLPGRAASAFMAGPAEAQPQPRRGARIRQAVARTSAR